MKIILKTILVIVAMTTIACTSKSAEKKQKDSRIKRAVLNLNTNRVQILRIDTLFAQGDTVRISLDLDVVILR